MTRDPVEDIPIDVDEDDVPSDYRDALSGIISMREEKLDNVQDGRRLVSQTPILEPTITTDDPYRPRIARDAPVQAAPAGTEPSADVAVIIDRPRKDDVPSAPPYAPSDGVVMMEAMSQETERFETFLDQLAYHELPMHRTYVIGKGAATEDVYDTLNQKLMKPPKQLVERGTDKWIRHAVGLFDSGKPLKRLAEESIDQAIERELQTYEADYIVLVCDTDTIIGKEPSIALRDIKPAGLHSLIKLFYKVETRYCALPTVSIVTVGDEFSNFSQYQRYCEQQDLPAVEQQYSLDQLDLLLLDIRSKANKAYEQLIRL